MAADEGVPLRWVSKPYSASGVNHSRGGRPPQPGGPTAVNNSTVAAARPVDTLTETRIARPGLIQAGRLTTDPRSSDRATRFDGKTNTQMAPLPIYGSTKVGYAHNPILKWRCVADPLCRSLYNHNTEGRRMDSFLQRFAGQIKGALAGFDRIVFKGCVRPSMYAAGAMAFLRARGALDKGCKDWMPGQSAALRAAAESIAQRAGGRGVEPIRSSLARKEDLARERQRRMGAPRPRGRSGSGRAWKPVSPIGHASTPRPASPGCAGSGVAASICTSTTTIRSTASPASVCRRGSPAASGSPSTTASGCAARSTRSGSPAWFMATSSCASPTTTGRNGCRRGRTMRAGRRCWKDSCPRFFRPWRRPSVRNGAVTGRFGKANGRPIISSIGPPRSRR